MKREKAQNKKNSLGELLFISKKGKIGSAKESMTTMWLKVKRLKKKKN